jgi:peroxidase
LNFARSIYQVKKKIRTNINTVSSWLDASNIYGTDQKTADSLREFKNGKLKVSQDDFLPKTEKGEFISGDRRVNENVLLTVVHTIFLR